MYFYTHLLEYIRLWRLKWCLHDFLRWVFDLVIRLELLALVADMAGKNMSLLRLDQVPFSLCYHGYKFPLFFLLRQFSAYPPVRMLAILDSLDSLDSRCIVLLRILYIVFHIPSPLPNQNSNIGYRAYRCCVHVEMGWCPCTHSKFPSSIAILKLLCKFRIIATFYRNSFFWKMNKAI